MSNEEFYIPGRADLRWIALDLDGTCAEPAWAPGKLSVIGSPIPGAVEKAWAASEAGYKNVLHTARPWSEYEMIEQWLIRNEFPVRQIQCGKILAHRYVDDKAIPASAERWY